MSWGWTSHGDPHQLHWWRRGRTARTLGRCPSHFLKTSLKRFDFKYSVCFSFKIAQWPFYLYGIWSNLRCRWPMGSMAPKNKIQSTKICLVCPTRITFVHQIWYLMNSPICQVEHSPFHFIPYSVPHIYRSSTTALRRLYIVYTIYAFDNV